MPIAIGSDVWVGAHATILGDGTIGTGAVITAGAVVKPRPSVRRGWAVFRHGSSAIACISVRLDPIESLAVLGSD